MGFFDKVKDVANKVGDTAEKGVKSASDNYKKMAEKSRLKKEIGQAEQEINRAYNSIGRKYFEINSAAPGEEYAEFISKIFAENAKADQLRAELDALEDKMPCPSCGAGLDRTQKFCDKCGAKIETPAAPVQTDNASKTSCPTCGAEVLGEQKFCEKCGTKIEAASVPVENVEAEVIEATEE